MIRLYRPVDDPETLALLAAKVAKTRARFRRFSRLALPLAAFFLFMQLIDGGPDDPAGLLMALVLAAATAIFAARALHNRPRTLAAQRLLLQHRGLLLDEGRPAAILGEETAAILERIRARITAEPAPRRDLAVAVDRAESASETSLAILEESEAQQQHADDGGARERRRATLETFRTALARVEIDALLAGRFEAGAADALARAAELLDDAPRAAEGTGAGGRPTSTPTTST